MAITDQEFQEFAGRTDRPIPGQSLTDDPDKPSPYEQPPEFTSKEDAIDYFLDMFLEERTYGAIMDTLEEGTPVMDIVQAVLVNAFQEGKINPDLMLILAEPLAYLLLGLSEREGIRAKIVTDLDDPDDPDDLDNWTYDDDDDETTRPIQNPFRNRLQSIKKPKADKELNLDEIIKQAPSLMDRQVPSLMAK